MSETFQAYYVQKVGNRYEGKYSQISTDLLPGHDVQIKVQYSSLNYKDALSARGLNKVTKNYPHIPGIDASGVVFSDRSGTFVPGDEVIVTGYDLGTNTFGGYGSLISVPPNWVIPMPSGLDPLQSMIVGTAGFTAVYGIKRLQREMVTPESGPVLVTGASGGVGSFAVFALSALGYEVIACSRKPDENFLRKLGASRILTVSDITDVPSSPLLKRKWTGAIDTVGGGLLDVVLRQTEAKGAVACCGNILGMQIESNILPFILRGISLLGIDSAFCKYQLRSEIWELISHLDLKSLPDGYYRLIEPDELDGEIDRILKGEQKGRVVLHHPE